MVVKTLPRPTGGYTAAIEFHDGRLLIQFPLFGSAEAAREWAEQWVRDAIAAHTRRLAEAGRNLQLVEA